MALCSTAAWNATANNQLLTGAALCSGAQATGLYVIDVGIPPEDDLKICSGAYIIAHTNAGSGVSNQLKCPTKATFFSQF